MWAANTIPPASMQILCIAIRYNKPSKSENCKSILFFNKTRALVLFLGFQYFELQKFQFLKEFQNLAVSSFIYSGAGISPIWFALALVLNSENNFIIAKLIIWVWCGVAIMNGPIVYIVTNAF